MDGLQHFPDLPDCQINNPWSANVIEAHRILSDTYDHLTTILRHEDAEPMRLHIHVETIERQIFPIISALVDEDEMQLDQDWVVRCANIFSRIGLQLQRAALAFESMLICIC